jgi:uncharacterized protein (TIGR02569 family)
VIPLGAFGLTGEPVPLAGGQGRSWRVGDVALKQVDDVEEAAWCAAVLDAVEEDGFRVARPLRALDGSWVVDGWSASHWVDGETAAPDWAAVRRVGRSFHAALKGVPRPDLVDRRTHRWAVADRVVWDGLQVQLHDDRLRGWHDELLARLEPVDVVEQVVHGDLTGNVLTGAGVLDFSPYWRSPDHADAQVVLDASIWFQAPSSLANGVDPQLLLRALLFRVVALDSRAQADPAALAEAELFEKVVRRW